MNRTGATIKVHHSDPSSWPMGRLLEEAGTYLDEGNERAILT